MRHHIRSDKVAMTIRLPMATGAIRAPSRNLFSFIRSFSTADGAPPPPRESPRYTKTSSSVGRLEAAVSMDRKPRYDPQARNSYAGLTKSTSNQFAQKAFQSLKKKQEEIDFLRNRHLAANYVRQIPRRWRAGDVYSPRDLGPREMAKWRFSRPVTQDVVDFLGFRPQDMYKNYALIQEFTNSSGQIRPRKETGLRLVNQRKIAKMIRRVQGMGIYPSMHDHPELIRADFYPSERQFSAQQD